MPHRVLVVDDEEAIRDLLHEYLEGRGYRVSVAIDGDEGIRVFESVRPHLALIDFLLPRKNGFAVADAIRRGSLPNTPIIMMSGVFKNPKTAVEAHEKYQVVDFLSKPLDLEELARLIDDTLAGVDPGPEIIAGIPVEPPKPGAEPSPRHASLILQDTQAAGPAPARSDPSPSSAPASHRPPSVEPAAVERPPARGLSYRGLEFELSGSFPSSPPSSAPEMGEIVNGVFHGRPFPELAEEGPIEQFPVALLLSTIRYDRSTGMLDMNNDAGTHRRIYIIEGNPTFMQSNAEGENVGALLLRRGRITEPDFERCLRYMKERGRTLQQSLLELRLVNEADLATAYKLLAGQLLPLAFGMSAGRYRWRISDAFVGRVPEGRFEPVHVLFEGIKKHVHPPQILKFFKGREDVPLVPTTEFQALMPFFQRAFGRTHVINEIDGHQTYRKLSRTHSADAATVIPQLFALVTSGMTVLPEVNDENALEIAVNVAAAEVESLGLSEDGMGLDMDASAADQKAREAIHRFHAEVMSRDFFQIFGATPQSSESNIKAAYFELAKRWNHDAFVDRQLGSARSLIDELFARITEAYETITDAPRRAEYLDYLNRKAKGLPTDVNEILKGEQLFDQATAMIQRRDFVNAASVLEEATKLNPDPIYFATLGWVTFNLDRASSSHVSKAVRLLKKAVQEQENLPVAYQYLGGIAYARGQQSEARKWWQRCLEWEPNNVEAARGLRLLVGGSEVVPFTGPAATDSGAIKK